jgi:hypothetical protein
VLAAGQDTSFRPPFGGPTRTSVGSSDHPDANAAAETMHAAANARTSAASALLAFCKKNPHARLTTIPITPVPNAVASAATAVAT